MTVLLFACTYSGIIRIKYLPLSVSLGLIQLWKLTGH